VKLSRSLISKGRYFRAFVDDIPDELVPADVARRAMKDDTVDYQKDLQQQLKDSDFNHGDKQQPVYYVKRGASYVEADLCQDLIPRERLYVKRRTGFKKSGIVVRS
jgi:hypothetical protein